MDKPQITIKTDGSAAGTQIYAANGVALTDVQKLELLIEAGKPTICTMTVLEISGELQAEVVAIEKKIVPPLRLEESVQLKVSAPRRHWGRMRCRYHLTKFTPLPTWGTRTDLLARGWTAPIGPLTIERTVK